MVVVVLYLFYFTISGFTTMCVKHIPSPLENASAKVEHIYTGPQDTELANAMQQCDPEVWKLIYIYDGHMCQNSLTHFVAELKFLHNDNHTTCQNLINENIVFYNQTLKYTTDIVLI